MMRIFRRPATNAVCLGLFTAFYSIVFLIASGMVSQSGQAAFEADSGHKEPFWKDWCGFLAAGHQFYLLLALVFLTVIVIVMLCLRRHPYDEYHTELLTRCLAVAEVLTLAAIALFFLLVLHDSSDIVPKFTLFIDLHWVTIVVSDFVYVYLCRWK